MPVCSFLRLPSRTSHFWPDLEPVSTLTCGDRPIRCREIGLYGAVSKIIDLRDSKLRRAPRSRPNKCSWAICARESAILYENISHRAPRRTPKLEAAEEISWYFVMPKGTMLVSRISEMTNTTLRMDDAHFRVLHCKYWLWGHNHRSVPEQVMQSPVVLGVDTASLNPSGTPIAMRRGRIWCVPTSEPSLLTTHVVRGQ